MANPTWGLLAKSLVDNETVEQAVARLIAVHNADPTAHLSATGSLLAHKADLTVDHPAGSVIADKIPDGELDLVKFTDNHSIIVTAFESLDGWSAETAPTLGLGNVYLFTPASLNTYNVLYSVGGLTYGLDWTKGFFWQSTVKILQTTNQEIYFGVGTTDHVGAGTGAGFYISNNTLYCYHATTPVATMVYTTFEIAGITLTDPHVYRIVYDPVTPFLAFYVDGVLKHTFTSGLPVDAEDRKSVFQIKTTNASAKYMYIFDMLASVPR